MLARKFTLINPRNQISYPSCSNGLIQDHSGDNKAVSCFSFAVVSVCCFGAWITHDLKKNSTVEME